MKKTLILTLLILLSLGVLAFIYFFVGISGGLKGVWYDLTDPSFDPNSAEVVYSRNAKQSLILSDFDFMDMFSSATEYGVYNTDLCVKNDYSWKRPINISSSLYTCTLISQRYYGLDGEYERTVRSLIKHFKLNNKELRYSEYQLAQLFVPKEWLSDGFTAQKLIKNYNIRNPDSQVSDVLEILSMLDAKNMTTVYTFTPSGEGYSVVLDFIDKGVRPHGTNNSDLYKRSDKPDLRDQYLSRIMENHQYGVVITIKNNYYKK